MFNASDLKKGDVVKIDGDPHIVDRTKPATLSTGLVVQVPEYMAVGEVIRVDTRTGEYASKA